MLAGLLGSFLVDEAPFYPIMYKMCLHYLTVVSARLISAILMVWMCMERIVLGYGSLGQVMVGAMFGIVLHFYSTRVPQYFIFIEAVLQAIFTGVLLYARANEISYEPGDPENLTSHFVWGLGIQLFTCLMLWRHYQNKAPQMQLSITKIIAEANLKSRQKKVNEEDIMIELPAEVKEDIRTVADIVYTFMSLLVMILLLFVAACISQYNWLS
jgi:hypothetical protein